MDDKYTRMHELYEVETHAFFFHSSGERSANGGVINFKILTIKKQHKKDIDMKLKE